MVRTQPFYCHGPVFDSWWETKITHAKLHSPRGLDGRKKKNWKKTNTIWLKELLWSDSNQGIGSMAFVLFLIFSHSVVSDFFRPHEQQHTRLPCFSPSPRVCSNSCALSWWCHSTIYPLSPLSPPALNFSWHQGLFQWVGSLIRWPKYWSFSFSINPSNEYSGLMSLGLTGLISLQSKELSRVFSITTIQSHQFFSTSFLYGPTLTPIHDCWINHSFDYTDLCWQSDLSAFEYSV